MVSTGSAESKSIGKSIRGRIDDIYGKGTKYTKDGLHNEGVIVEVAKELFDFLSLALMRTGVGKIRKKFDELDEEESAFFTVQARAIISKVNNQKWRG